MKLKCKIVLRLALCAVLIGGGAQAASVSFQSLDQRDFDTNNLTVKGRHSTYYYDLIRDGGAVGNGTTSDDAALDRAISFCQSNNAELWIPPAPVAYVITNVHVVSNTITMRGSGGQMYVSGQTPWTHCTFLCPSNNSFLRVDGVSGRNGQASDQYHFEGFNILGSANNNGTYGIWLGTFNPSDSDISQIIGVGVSNMQTGFIISNASNFKISSCAPGRCGTGIDISGLYNSGIVECMQVSYNKNFGIHLHGGTVDLHAVELANLSGSTNIAWTDGGGTLNMVGCNIETQDAVNSAIVCDKNAHGNLNLIGCHMQDDTGTGPTTYSVEIHDTVGDLTAVNLYTCQLQIQSTTNNAQIMEDTTLYDGSFLGSDVMNFGSGSVKVFCVRPGGSWRPEYHQHPFAASVTDVTSVSAATVPTAFVVQVNPQTDEKFMHAVELADGSFSWINLIQYWNDTVRGGGIAGYTDGSSASSGKIGEVLTNGLSLVNATSLSTGTALNVTNISLTAGDWDVTGVVGFNAGGTTTITAEAAGLTTTSATLPGLDTGAAIELAESLTGGVDNTIAMPVTRFNISSTTTVYLVAKSSFGVSTMKAYGFMRARRVR